MSNETIKLPELPDMSLTTNSPWREICAWLYARPGDEAGDTADLVSETIGKMLQAYATEAIALNAQALQAKIDALTLNAERYQWLQDHWLEVRACPVHPGRTPNVDILCLDDDGIGEGGDRLDAAIDQARQSTKETT